MILENQNYKRKSLILYLSKMLQRYDLAQNNYGDKKAYLNIELLSSSRVPSVSVRSSVSEINILMNCCIPTFNKD